MRASTTVMAASDSTLTARPTGDAALEPMDDAEAAADADVAVSELPELVAGAAADAAVDAEELVGNVTVSLELAVVLPAVELALVVVLVLVVEPTVVLPEPEAEGQRAGT
ncbi:unnamed protein product [Phytophthora fragariaefolia]|uniref:Unnamed protein product n=1 Tax=Phytophthora fragariaefolia TaxID=1490495 RepID=A0A9W6XTN2_9STRA|nr:unnamed protein product [Phytophthora fragariaefolia]